MVGWVISLSLLAIMGWWLAFHFMIRVGELQDEKIARDKWLNGPFSDASKVAAAKRLESQDAFRAGQVSADELNSY